MSVAVYGTNSDGTLSICRSKPENYGKGRCFHAEHTEFSLQDVRNGSIEKHNEGVIANEFKKEAEEAFKALPNVSIGNISNTVDGKALSKKELTEQAHIVADAINQEDFKFFQDFMNDYNRALSSSQRKMKFSDNVDNIHDMLTRDTENSIKLREFLGEEVNLRDLSEIMIQEIGAMTSSMRFNKTFSAPRRVLLTTFDNDMNKSKYVASILFFGGRCCYCNKVLHKGPPSNKGKSKQATGEHITPINPESGPVGSTRFGNMALACRDCNNKRGNTELKEWLTNDKNRPFPKEQAAKVLGRIQAFRKFAFYEEYSEEKSKQINDQVDRLTSLVHSKRAKNGDIDSDGAAEIKSFHREILHEMKHGKD